jgi:glycosyltransferase involved in cell wall biosynthesis
MDIVCVIPAYNEEKFIASVISKVPDFIKYIIVVNDASSDGTAEAVLRHGDPRVILIDHQVNKGVGGAMVSGYRKALEMGADIVVKLDGDGQMAPGNISRLIAPLQQGRADYAKGVRFRDVDVIRRMPLVRLIGNLGLSFLTKLASGYWNVFDPTNGFTAIDRAALELINLDQISRDYFYESDMLIRLYTIEAVVVDVPMPARYGDEVSHLNPLKVFFTFPGRLLRAFCRRVLWQYFILDFTALSAFLLGGVLLLAFGFCFGVHAWVAFNFPPADGTASKVVQGAPTGTIMLAVIPIILGFQLLLQTIVLDTQRIPQVPLSQKVTEYEMENTSTLSESD